MKTNIRASLPRLLRFASLAATLCWAVLRNSVAADQIEMQNGDRYFGKVLSVTTNTVVLQSEVLGTVNLPRTRVANISLGVVATNRTPSSVSGLQPATMGRAAFERQSAETGTPPAATNGNLSAAFRQLGGQTNFIKDVQSQYLNSAGPEANAKFNELVSGLMSGRLNVSDIRREAQSAANQLRAARKDLGSDDSGTIDEYLAILDKFVRETAGDSPTNNPVLPKPSK